MTNSDFQFAVALIGGLAWPIYGVVGLFALCIPQRASPLNSRLLARQMRLAGVILLALAFLLGVLALCGMASSYSHNQYGFRDGAVFGWISAWLLTSVGAVICAPLGLVVYVQAERLRRSGIDSEFDFIPMMSTCDTAKRCLALGHGFMAVVCSIVFVPFVLLLLVAALAWLPMTMLAGRSRSHSQLLMVLSIAIKHGRPLPTELRGFATTARSIERLRLLQLAKRLEIGDSLGDALRSLPGLLPDWAVAEIRSGESNGCLQETLARLIQRQLDSLSYDQSRSTVAGWITYGVAYGGAAHFLVGFLMVFIVPKFKAIFEGFGTELPQTTRLLIQVSDVIASYWFLGAPFIAAGGYLLVELMRGEASGWKTLRYSFLHRLFVSLDGPDILRQLSGVVATGRPLPEGLDVVARYHFRPSIRRALTQVAAATEYGADAFEELQRHRFISASDVKFLTTARQAGNLSWALKELAELRERRFSYRQRLWAEFVRPVPVLFGAVVVLFVAVSFFMPIIKLLNDLS